MCSDLKVLSLDPVKEALNAPQLSSVDISFSSVFRGNEQVWSLRKSQYFIYMDLTSGFNFDGVVFSKAPGDAFKSKIFHILPLWFFFGYPSVCTIQQLEKLKSYVLKQ